MPKKTNLNGFDKILEDKKNILSCLKEMLSKIEENYSYARLMSDYEILRDANHKINFDASHYKPLKFIITKNKIQILSQNTIINEISK